MLIREWAAAWNIPLAAILDLEARMGQGWRDVQGDTYNTPTGEPGSEGRQQSLVRLEAAKRDILLFRNNVGALPDKGGRFVRYGLANDSERANKAFKSGDLIGVRRVVIAPWHVGKVLGQFVSREIKHEAWVHTADEHEQAQDAWANLINSYGGDARYATGPGSFNDI